MSELERMNNGRLVLMLEDDPDDRFITETTLKELGYSLSIRFFKNSTELLEYLEVNTMPSILLLDYNSAPLNALEILKHLKSNESHKGMPIVVLGDSSNSTFVSECYKAGANSVIKKPKTESATKDKISSFFSYWLNTVEV